MSTTRIAEFDTWRAGYADDSVAVYLAGTTTPANIFTDEALSIAADNPQTLTTRTVDDVSYGRWAAPLYTAQAYELVINSVDRTGVIRPPLITLADEDASDALVTVAGGTEAIALDDHLARRIDVRDYGDFIAVGGVGASAATNQATLAAAIGVASAAGGGFVETPAGTYAHTGGGTVPQGVVLRGAGRGATVLQSTLADNVWIIGGSRAGFSRLTLDGVSLVALSVGIFAADKDDIVLDDVEVKRFETGIYRKGGSLCAWRNLFLSNCTNGAKLHGDTSSSGAALTFNDWQGGTVELCGTLGIEFKYVDAACDYGTIKDVLFDTNTGTAVKLTGARSTELRHCQWNDNTVNLSVADASPATASNTVKGFEITDGSMSGGTIALTGTLEKVAFRRMAFSGVTATLTTPTNNIHVEDCRETTTTIAGDAVFWRRHRTGSHNASTVRTTDATPTTAWSLALEPGEFARLQTTFFARRINGVGHVGASQGITVRRIGSTLAYELQTGNFTTGETLTGGTSGATGTIVVVNDLGATGLIQLYDIVGEFVDNEIITDGLGGSATTDGTLTEQPAAVVSYHILSYDAQTANFVVGATLTGASSGATATIRSDIDSGATGQLSVSDITGAFIDNEPINDSSGGTAVANGVLQISNTFGASPAFGAQDGSDGTAYGFLTIANDTQIEIRVIGTAGHTLDWLIDVEVVRLFR